MSTPHPSHPTGGPRLAELDTVSVSVPAGEEPEPARRDGNAPVGPVAVLEIRRGPDAGRRFVLATDTVTVVGRHPGCGIVLANVTVSRRHAEIRPSQHGFVLADTGSLNGTYLNLQPVDTAILAHGDQVKIGVFRLTYHAAQDTTQLAHHSPAGDSPAGSSPQPSTATIG